MTTQVDRMTPEEMAEAIMTLSPSQAAAVASRYAALKGAAYVTKDGDVLDAATYKRELELAHEQLKRFIEKDGPLVVEGVGTLRMQDRALGWSWDCKSMAENDMKTFARLLEMGAVTLDSKVALALEEAGQVTGFKGYGLRGNTTALVIDREGR